MKIYPSQRSLISMLFFGRINELENQLDTLKRKLTNPKTKANALTRLQHQIEWQSDWLAELKEAYEQYQTQEAELQKQYDLLVEDYLQSLRDRVDFMYEIAEERLAEIDLYIQRERSDAEYLSRESLEVRFKICRYRQN
jgi:predicted  nucleic acid-binding Zn-ribbon protein